MASRFRSALVVSSAALICLIKIGCSPSVSEPPIAPRWVCQTSPTSLKDYGIGHAPNLGNNRIRLEWYLRPPGEDVEQYLLYKPIEGSGDVDVLYRTYFTDAIDPNDIVDRPDGKAISISDEVNPGHLGLYHYYVLFTVSSDGIQSVRSDTAAYALLPTPTLVTPEPFGIVVDDPRPTLGFERGQGTASSLETHFVIRVFADDLILEPVWVSHINGPVYGQGLLQFGTGGTIWSDRVQNLELPAGRYRWGVEVLGSKEPQNPAESINIPCSCASDLDRCADADSSLLPASSVFSVGVKSQLSPFTIKLTAP